MLACKNGRPRTFKSAAAACFLFSLLSSPPLPAEDVDVTADVFFFQRVLPVFQQKCFACHGNDPDDVRGDLNMLTRDGLLKGGASNVPTVVPGAPEQSLLYQAIQWDELEMPPKENDRLTQAQIRDIRQWIGAGAPWPTDQRLAESARRVSDTETVVDQAAPVAAQASAVDSNRQYDPKNLWAYQPLWDDTEGSLRNSTKNAIDTLIDERLSQLGLAAAPPADRHTLIRRATFDLIGLPPTPDEIDAFLNDTETDDAAFSKVVERLLASPHYGEQWGRHWLDVVRYADSSGYANDYERGTAWRYRDYVVRAFNNDKPYDRFICEQIAGDELDPTNPEFLISVGFLRAGPWELTGMEVAKVARQRFLDDVTDAVGQVFLAQASRCASCHDHKFDPVPTHDYYSLQAAFATTQLAHREAPFLPDENTQGFEEQQFLHRRLQRYEAQLQEINQKSTRDAARQWYIDNGLNPTEFDVVVEELLSERKPSDPPITLDVIRSGLAARNTLPELIFPLKVGYEPDDFGRERIARKGIERIQWQLERYQPIAFSVYSGRTPQLKAVYSPLRMPADFLSEGELEETCVLVGGDPFSPSEKVQPGVLSMISTNVAEEARLSFPQQLPSTIMGRRLSLAAWIANKDNPLTARVMVNRIWQWHLGQALAGNPNNFGATGKRPTHPELLDLLARRFVQQGWSVKAMHRLIMNTEIYRRSSHYARPEELAARDSEGTSYAVFRPRRLDAEELRDAMLCVSGELNPTLGGIPVRPEMNSEAALQPRMVMGTFAEAWQPSPLPSQRHRRSLYALRLRGQRDPFQEVFDSPAPDSSCEARQTSTVTPQVFAMFNSELIFDRALALAHRIVQDHKSPEKAISHLFQLTLGRDALPAEIELCLAHWRRMTARHKMITFDAPKFPSEVVREALEENTGVKFTYVEPLEVYEQFVPDLKPAQASPELRGLAEVCLVIINSNEFAYIY